MIAFVKDEWLLEVDIKLNLLAVTFPPFSNTNEASNKRFSRIPTCKKYGEKKKKSKVNIFQIKGICALVPNNFCKFDLF